MLQRPRVIAALHFDLSNDTVEVRQSTPITGQMRAFTEVRYFRRRGFNADEPQQRFGETRLSARGQSKVVACSGDGYGLAQGCARFINMTRD
jgi:hypothetical protein